jgi:lysozyme
MSLIEELLKEEEGLFLQAYDDGTERVIRPGTTLKGHPTIGYGRALDVEGITKEEALYLLQNDIAEVQTQATSAFSWFKGLSEVRQTVILSMIFNLGLHGFSQFTSTIAAIERGDFETASTDMLNSLWARQVGHRATELATMMGSNQAPNQS